MQSTFPSPAAVPPDASAGDAAVDRLVDASPDGMAVVRRPEGIVLRVNPALCRVTGQSEVDLLERPIDDLRIWRPAGGHATIAEALLGGGAVAHALVVFTRADGSESDASLSAHRIMYRGRDAALVAVRDQGPRARASADPGLEESFRDVFDNAPVGMLAFGVDGAIERANDAFGRILGRPAAWLVKRSIADAGLAAIFEANRKEVDELLAATRPAVEIETSLRRASGATCLTRITVTAVRDQAGHPRRLVAHVEDVTAQREAEAALRRSEQRLRGALDSAMDAFELLRACSDGEGGIDFEILDLNARGELLLGAAREAMIGARLSQVASSAFLEAVRPTFERVLLTHEPVDEEIELAMEGETYVLRQQVVATAEGIAVMSRDVTELRLAERRRAAEERIANAVFEGSPVGIQLFDAHGVSQRMNESLRALLGVPSRDYGVGAFNILMDPITQLTGEAGQFARAYRGETVQEFEYDVDMGLSANVWATRDDVMTIARTIFPLHDEDGAVTGVVSFSRDVTERRRLERKLEFLAYHDPLTQLANRKLFADHLARALRPAGTGMVAVAFLDMDDFKRVNDRMGHAGGDALLVHVGAALRASVRETDLAARLGGDEFGVILDAIGDPSDARRVLDRILVAVNQPCRIGDEPISAAVSAGLVVASRGADPETVLREADRAMYAAKAAGKGRVVQRQQMITRRSRTRRRAA